MMPDATDPTERQATHRALRWQVDHQLRITDYQGETQLFAKRDDALDSYLQAPQLLIYRNALAGESGLYEHTVAERQFIVCVEPATDGCSAVAIEITRYHQAQQVMASLKRHNELILEAAGEGIYGLNMKGEATFVNPAATDMTGWSAEETIGGTIHYKHHHSHADGTHYPHEECPIYAAIMDGEVHHVDDEVFWRKDGSSFPVEYTSTPIHEEGQLAGAVVVFKDISERKQAEQTLLKAFQEVEQLKERLQEQNLYLQEEISQDHNFGEIIGQSAPIQQLLQEVQQVATTDATVMILGESGTGKELIARAIHQRSARSEKPLVKINCGAISAGLVESELFGHEKGAFTGAVGQRKGRFELADGGTLFLDEVGELPLDTQVKLLRALQEQEFERVGSSTPIRVDVRIIAATNRDLLALVRQGAFRQDLYYRLNVFPLEMPPLRERVTDIPLLVQHFIQQAARKLGKPIEGISQEGMTALQQYPWPGNIRELQNVIERAAILNTGVVLSVTGLLPSLSIAVEESPLLSLEALERRHIKKVLAHAEGVIAGPKGAAHILGLHPNTLRSRMLKLGIRF
ncbi:MAG: sigma 54-interacting transcriptional regulator [Candidatus Polarisedimenticolaceae bacterium]|nr:sigma 54-interacting transcriptional regulator [Candidatus Polarisedimenticolaceae bacterium]